MTEEKITILIVDDDPANLQIIVDNFERAHKPYILIKAPNGEIALMLAKKRQPNMVITDWEMPVMDGIELIERLKQDKATRDIPVIMCTGVMTASTHLNTALQAGAVDFIRKPIDPVELLARTRTMLRLAAQMKQIRVQNIELAKNIEYKQKKLITLAETLARKNSHIKELEKYAPDRLSDSSMSERVLAGLEETINVDDWDMFMADFNHNYPHFLERLIGNHPDLSKQELRVCCLIKINLSTRQIADLLYLSRRSVETHRYNMRKKMGISSKQDLKVFLDTF